VSEPPWTLLQAPFPRSAVTWDPTEISDSGDEALVVPRLTGAALRERFDAALGATGWSLTLAPVEGGVICSVRVGDVTKSAAADPVRVGRPSAERTADLAFARAAAGLGLRAPIDASLWAPFDVETGTILDEAVAAEVEAAEPEAPAVSSGPPAVPAPDVMRESADARGLTAEGQQMIDRLLERLKDEGQGLSAARLLVKHGGYGNDPASARELYTQLRDLLLRTSERAPDEASRQSGS
jgi:hypothetical protein